MANLNTSPKSHYLEQELNNLIKSEENIFKFITENTTDGMWFWDLEKPSEEWMNSDFWKTLGYDPKIMPHKSAAWQNIIHPEDLKSATENLHLHCNNPNYPYNQIVRYTHQFGKTVWIKCKGIAIRDENGKAIRMLGMHENVSELKETQIKLNSQIELNQHIMESSGIGSWKWDIVTGKIEISDLLANLIGYSKIELGDLNFENWQRLLHRDDLKRVLDELNLYLEGVTEKLEVEGRFKHKEGHWIWILAKGKVISRNSNGFPVAVIGTQQDISSRKRNELLLTRYKSLIETTTNVSSIGSWEVNLDLMASYWSDVTKKIHEVPYDFVSTVENGINFYKEGESRDKISTLFNDAVVKAKQFDDIFEIVTAKGNIKYVRAIGVPIVKNGKVVSVNGLFQDVDSETRLNQKLKLQEEQFRQTFEFAAIGMAIVGLNGKWVQVNKSITKMLGYTEAELMQLTFQDITHPEDLKNDIDLLDNLVNRKIEAYTMEKRYFHKDGSTIWASLSVSMVSDNNGKPKHFVSQINNISEAKANAKLSKESLLKLEDQNNRLLNFAHIVSHNLRSHVLNFSMLLDIYKVDFPEQTENEIFPMLTEASDSLTETIEHLNEVVQIQSTEEKIDTILLLPEINKAMHSLKAEIQNLQAEIIVEVNSNVKVLAIPAYIESIVLNLISNALRYSSNQRIPQLIISSSDNNPGIIKVLFKDNGLGIDLVKNGDKIFKMYKTFHQNAEARGVGLFITKNQCEAMNGTIEVMSEVGIGSTFVVSLLNAE
jgi:PAS domain S-box-containing protein